MLCPAKGWPGWQVRGQLAQLSPSLGHVIGIGTVVVHIKIKAADS